MQVTALTSFYMGEKHPVPQQCLGRCPQPQGPPSDWPRSPRPGTSPAGPGRRDTVVTQLDSHHGLTTPLLPCRCPLYHLSHTSKNTGHATTKQAYSEMSVSQMFIPHRSGPSPASGHSLAGEYILQGPRRGLHGRPRAAAQCSGTTATATVIW